MTEGEQDDAGGISSCRANRFSKILAAAGPVETSPGRGRCLLASGQQTGPRARRWMVAFFAIVMTWSTLLGRGAKTCWRPNAADSRTGDCNRLGAAGTL